MIHYIVGDATLPVTPRAHPVIIAHVCNDRGVWGGGFTKPLTLRHPEAARMYRSSLLVRGEVLLVGTQYAKVKVCNMIAQGLGGKRPLDDTALLKCLKTVVRFAHIEGSSVHMPRIGCGLAGGTWAEVLPILEKAHEVAPEVQVYVYDLPGTR